MTRPGPADLAPVLVLGGGPDAEREVSLKSAAAVASALRAAGHAVTQADLTPDDTAALDAFASAHGTSAQGTHGVVFPALHGPWGEGGGAQVELERRGCRFVGAGSEAAVIAMDKTIAKWKWDAGDPRGAVPTPRSVDVRFEQTLWKPRVEAAAWTDGSTVIKPACEGSSFGLRFAENRKAALTAARSLKRKHAAVLMEQRIRGKELTVGLVGDTVLPPIWIRPADTYDFAGKYERDDTVYEFDLGEDEAVVARVKAVAVEAAARLGIGGPAALARVDLMLDAAGVPWVLELNTMPGFTDHSLLPMAARAHGWDMPELCSRLVGAAEVKPAPAPPRSIFD